MPGNYSLVETVVTGQAITAAERNTEHQNHIDNATPAGIDDYSATVTEMRTVADPYPAASPSQATSTAGELARIRYLLTQITGKTYWYEDPEAPQTSYRLEADDHTHATTGLQGGTVAHSVLTGLTSGDPHTQYRLESEDHTHATTGLQGGTVAHSALTGLTTGDDHTQYALESGSIGVFTTKTHSLLTSLTADDHTNYVLLAGRTGGQTLYFDTASGAGSGAISSTSHATKGKWFLNAASTIAVDEANVRFGIGVASPTVALDVAGSAKFGGVVTTDDTLAMTRGGVATWALTTAASEPKFILQDGGANTRVSFDMTNGKMGTGIVPLARMLAVASQNLAVNTTAWTTTLATYQTFSSITVAAGDVIEIAWQGAATSGASTLSAQISIDQSAGSATLKFFSTAGTTLTTNFGIASGALNTATGYIASGTTRLFCTGSGTATLILRCITTGGDAAGSSIVSSLQVLKNS